MEPEIGNGPAAVSEHKPKPVKAAKVLEIKIPELKLGHIELTLVGDSPLICHNWSQKSRQKMLAKQMMEAEEPKEARNPEQEYQDSLYKLPNGKFGFPAVAFKSAAVDICTQVGIFKTHARAALHIDADMVEIDGIPEHREDMVRLNGKTADTRFRAQFKEWKVTFIVTYNSNILSPQQIVNLFNNAGYGIGVGEWRPQRDGSFGRFHVKRTSE